MADEEEVVEDTWITYEGSYPDYRSKEVFVLDKNFEQDFWLGMLKDGTFIVLNAHRSDDVFITMFQEQVSAP